MAGIFIDVELSDEVRADAQLAAKLTELCPVDIYAERRGAEGESQGVEVVEENLDECILCELCVRAAPPGGVRVLKLYDDRAALER